MLRPVRIRFIDVGLVAVGRGDGGLRIVRHDDLVDPAEELHRAHMGANPVAQTLGPRALDVGVITRPLGRDKNMDLARLARLRIDDLHRRTGVIHKELLARLVLEAHRHVQRLRPRAVEFAIAAVAVALRVDRPVLLPQQLERHALPAQLPMDRRPIRQRPFHLPRPGRRREQQRPQRPLVHFLGQRPRKPRRLGPHDVFPCRRNADATARGNRPMAQAVLET